jgi:DNA-binding MarR family transcriptional regulator
MTQLVDRLETDGLVQRVTCASDRRLVKAEITYTGREKQTAGEAEVGRVESEFAAQVRPEDRELLTRLLSSIR